MSYFESLEDMNNNEKNAVEHAARVLKLAEEATRKANDGSCGSATCVAALVPVIAKALVRGGEGGGV